MYYEDANGDELRLYDAVEDDMGAEGIIIAMAAGEVLVEWYDAYDAYDSWEDPWDLWLL